MTRRKLVMAAMLLMLSAGCTVQKDMVPLGGSRADGTVSMGFEYGMFEKPEVDRNVAAATAAERCRAWGYENAHAFGGTTRQCVHASGGDCYRWIVKVPYQCTGL